MDNQKKNQLKRIYYTRWLTDLLSKFIFFLCLFLFFLPVAFGMTIAIYWYMYRYIHPDADLSYLFRYIVIYLCITVIIVAIAFLSKTIINIIISLLEKITLSKENTKEYSIKQDIIRIKRETHCTAENLFLSILKITKITITIFVSSATVMSCIPYINIWLREADSHSFDDILTLFFTITSFILGPIILYVRSNRLLKKEIKNIKISINVTQDILNSQNKTPVPKENHHTFSEKYYAYHLNPKPRRRTYTKLSNKHVDEMTGIEFEDYCASLLNYLDYSNVGKTKVTGDQGVDITAFKDGIKYAIQCKRYHKKVGNSAVQEVIAGMKMYNCEKPMVMTNNYYTKGAISVAEVWDVELIDRDELENMQRKARAVQASHADLSAEGISAVAAEEYGKYIDQ